MTNGLVQHITVEESTSVQWANRLFCLLKMPSEACLSKYGLFLFIILSREKPGDPEWHTLEDKKIPFLLNFCQCKLSLGEYYPVIEHTTTVLKREPGWYLFSYKTVYFFFP